MRVTRSQQPIVDIKPIADTLYQAIGKRDWKTAKVLIARGEGLKYRNSGYRGRTFSVLHFAVEREAPDEILELLVREGKVPVLVQAEYGYTPDRLLSFGRSSPAKDRMIGTLKRLGAFEGRTSIFVSQHLEYHPQYVKFVTDSNEASHVLFDIAFDWVRRAPVIDMEGLMYLFRVGASVTKTYSYYTGPHVPVKVNRTAREEASVRLCQYTHQRTRQELQTDQMYQTALKMIDLLWVCPIMLTLVSPRTCPRLVMGHTMTRIPKEIWMAVYSMLGSHKN